MLKFYYHPLSPIARRVWWALLEKAIPFEAIEVDLGHGEQFTPDMLAINPFHHVPFIVNDGFRLVESLAILDYLERKHPTPALLPDDLQAYAQVRMVQMVVVNELMTKILSVAVALEDAEAFAAAEEKIGVSLAFLDQALQGKSFFGGHRLSLADIVAGSTVPLFYRLGISLTPYPNLAAWQDRIVEREAWRQTNPSDKAFAVWKRFVSKAVKK